MLPRSDLVAPALRTGYGRWPFDVARARTLLADNGWDVSQSPAVCVHPGTGPGEAGEGIPAGTRLSLSLRYADGRPALARLMRRFAADAARAGIELRLSAVVGSVLVAEDGPGRHTPEHPKLWELSNWGGGWIYNYPTGENLFQSDAAANFSNWRDPRADELIARSVADDDLTALYEYQDYIVEQVPVLFMPTTPRRIFEVASHLRGFAPLNPYGLINPENWYYVEESG
jgi:peptide/nickel transport system substrate-binding protein